MIELNEKDVWEVSGTAKFNFGTAFAAIAVGIITGGPVGLGYALCSITIIQGINNLEEIIIEY